MASPTEETGVDSYCIDFCKGKLTVLGVDVEAAWKPKVRDGENQPSREHGDEECRESTNGLFGRLRRARDLFLFFFFGLGRGQIERGGCTSRGV